MDEGSPAALSGAIEPGDYVVRMNDHVVCSIFEAEHFLFEAQTHHEHIDLVVTRLEPLPQAPEFLKLTDLELEELAFRTAALRVRVVSQDAARFGAGKTRGSVIDLLAPRFENKSLNRRRSQQLNFQVLTSMSPPKKQESLWDQTKRELASTGSLVFQLGEGHVDSEA